MSQWDGVWGGGRTEQSFELLSCSECLRTQSCLVKMPSCKVQGVLIEDSRNLICTLNCLFNPNTHSIEVRSAQKIFTIIKNVYEI